METEISIEGLFEVKHAEFGLLEMGELCHALLDGIIHLLLLLYNTELPTLFKAPSDEEFGTVKGTLHMLSPLPSLFFSSLFFQVTPKPH
jgi:hypothetical protein